MTLALPTRPWTGTVRREVLPNGLTLLVQRDDSAPAVAVVTYVRAGFFDEPDRWVGISHVLEHMFFKGTPSRGVGQIARETKAAGGYLNASTSYDRTSYFVVLPSSALPAAIDIQADALRNSTIDAGELARELQVIIQEANRKLDTPDAVAYETLHELMFDRHRMRRWRIGTAEQLAGYTRDDVNGYYRSRYVPGRTIVSVVGAVDEDETLALLRKTYDDWAPGDGAHDPSPAEPAQRSSPGSSSSSIVAFISSLRASISSCVPIRTDTTLRSNVHDFPASGWFASSVTASPFENSPWGAVHVTPSSPDSMYQICFSGAAESLARLKA